MPGLVALALAHVRARDGQAGLTSRTRPQLALFTLFSVCVLRIADVAAQHAIPAHGLGG